VSTNNFTIFNLSGKTEIGTAGEQPIKGYPDPIEYIQFEVISSWFFANIRMTIHSAYAFENPGEASFLHQLKSSFKMD
jgi:hypothetical protein